MTTAIVPAKERLATIFDRALPLLRQVAAKHISPERLVKVAQMAASQQPLLLECDPVTVVLSVVRAAEMGLEVGGGFGHAYLVPFKNRKTGKRECQLIVGYQGYIELALRTGKVLDIRSIPVFDHDHFEYEEGTTPKIKHVPNFDQERNWGTLKAVYAIATLAGGIQKLDVMSKADIARIRGKSQAQDSGPWNTDPLEMARKCPVRRLQKYLPKTREMAQAIALDEADEGVPLPPETFDVGALADPETPKQGVAAVRERLAAKPEPTDDLAEDQRIAAQEAQ